MKNIRAYPEKFTIGGEAGIIAKKVTNMYRLGGQPGLKLPGKPGGSLSDKNV